MKVCEECIGKGYTERVYHGAPIKVVCPGCHGVGSLSLGHESHERWRHLRQIALSRAIREGWYHEIWAGDPGTARKVLCLIGEPEFVQRSA